MKIAKLHFSKLLENILILTYLSCNNTLMYIVMLDE